MFKQLFKNALAAPKTQSVNSPIIEIQNRGTQDLKVESDGFQNVETQCSEFQNVEVRGIDIPSLDVRNPEIQKLEEGFVVGNRIPRDYFLTRGTGQSDIAVHAGSYHLALKQAGIEMANIITYSSILPKIANMVDRSTLIEHGAVMETIMSVCNCEKGQRATAGIIYAWLYDKITGEKYGGLVCEHQGNQSKEELQKSLEDSLEELYVNGFDDRFELRDTTTLLESFTPEKKYGTALVALCFINYFYPILGRQ